ncbi:hypothetical protein C815_01443 [Firmicutes bacterium M10-2]|nr:hypothetical protein C815_01443 [Firmicutes bacterium M10-2]
MNKKSMTFAAIAAMMLVGCSSSTNTPTTGKTEEASEKQEIVSKKQEDTSNSKQDIKSDVIDGIISDLKNDGYQIENEYEENNITNASITTAEKGNIDYEFFVFADDADAKNAMDTIYQDESSDKDSDTTLTLSDDKTQIEKIDHEDNETTLYVLNDNVIVKGNVPSSQYDDLKEQFITWGFLYGEQVTNQDIEATEKNN